MSETLDVGRTLADATFDQHRLGECKKMLVSPRLMEGFRDAFKDREIRLPIAETIYIRGVPVVECEQLEGLEYAFVK